jgi:hypothetical protein
MSKYVFQLSPCSARLEIERSVLPNTWNDPTAADCLVVNSGFVDASQGDRLICNADNKAVVTLLDANRDSQVGAHGSATCDLCTNTPNQQTWTLVSRP